MLMRTLLLICLFVMSTLPAQADELRRIVSNKASAIALTIYPDNLALITETRTVDLPVGKSRIVFEDVNDRMIPASILLRQFEGLTLERNFDTELVSKANLFERSIGKTVLLTRTDHRSGKVRHDKATIISAGQGVVFKIGNNLESFQCSGLGETTRFDDLPEGLNDVPELSIDVDTSTAGPIELIISYLADGFHWAADYRLDVAGKTSGMFSGWLTFSNQTSQSFKNAPVSVVAGTLNRSYQTRSPAKQNKTLAAHCWPRQSSKTPILRQITPPKLAKENKFSADMVDEIVVTATRQKKSFGYTAAPDPPEEENLSEYKLYRMSEPLTLSSYQTKQIRFLDKPDIDFTPVYTFKVGFNQLLDTALQSAILEDRLDNSKDGKLAKALPKGTYRIFAKDKSGHNILIGEDELDNLAIDLPVKIKAATSFNVQMMTRILSQKTVKSKGRQRQHIDVEQIFFNAFDRPVQVEIKPDRQYQWMYFDIKNPSLEPDADKTELKWTFTLPAGQSQSFQYTAIQ